MASEQRKRLAPSVKIGFLYKLAPKGNSPDRSSEVTPWSHRASEAAVGNSDPTTGP